MAFKTLLQKAAKYAIDHSPTILTGVSVVAAAATTYFASRASFRVGVQVGANNHLQYDEHGYSGEAEYIESPREIAEYVHQSDMWKEYLPAVGLGILTIGSIVASDKIHRNRQAGLAAVFALSQRAYMEYRDKVVETLGERKHQKLLAEIGQDRVEREFLENPDRVPDERDSLCYDKFSGHWFDATEQDIRDAENQINSTLVHANFASLADLYSMLDIPVTAKDHECGWHHDNGLLKIEITHARVHDIPCTVIDFVTEPARGYHRFH